MGTPAAHPQRRDVLTIVAAVVVVAAVAFAARGAIRQRDRFASARAHALCAESRAIFGRTGGATTYTEFKAAVPKQADPVLYADIRDMWKTQSLTPEGVEQALN
jgi:hypothetical protein